MLQDSDLIVPWLALNNTGQWLLLLLFITYVSAQHLPQRNNAYLVNFILTTFLGTIPPSLLFYSGYQYSPLPRNLCITQFSLVNGIAPMFITAQLALVFDTWSELRSLCIHTPHISRNTYVKCFALIAPYLSLGVWTFAAFEAALATTHFSSYTLSKADYVYCRSPGDATQTLLKAGSIFLVIVMIVQVILEVWVAWMIYAYPSKVHDDCTAWRTNIQFSLRVIILSFLQFLSVFLSILNTAPAFHHDSLKRAYELLDSMNPLAVFLIIGMQTNVLKTWKNALLRLWALIIRKKPEEEDEIQPQGYPGLDWAYVPSKSFPSAVAPFNDYDVDGAEKGKGASAGGGGGVKQMLKTKITFPKVALRLGRR